MAEVDRDVASIPQAVGSGARKAAGRGGSGDRSADRSERFDDLDLVRDALDAAHRLDLLERVVELTEV